MRTAVVITFILPILTNCSQQSDNLTLVFPTGRYTDWTTYESINLAFKLNGGQLDVDSNYNFKTKEFTVCAIEKSVDYPALTAFLKKRFDELRRLSEDIRDSSCSRLTPMYLERKTTQRTDILSFTTVGECGADRDGLMGVVEELVMLREKYAR